MQGENKKKYAFWLSPETKRSVEAQYQSANCKSQSEYVENALRFYAGYRSANGATDFLAPIIAQTMRGTMDGFCTHISRNLFRLAVEEAKVWNILAAAVNIPPEMLPSIHGKAIGEVKRMNGRLTIEQIVANPPVIETADATEEDE